MKKILEKLKSDRKLEGCYKIIAQLEMEKEILTVNNETLTNNLRAKDVQIKDLTETNNLILQENEELKKIKTKFKNYMNSI